ncbi:MAG: hypothetical protein KDC83_06440 [Flavobacteriales bacterium]|nr:hypothetical protein [Flavobacteriales bacterium]
MEILKTATDWAKAELVSTPFFMLFGVVFVVTSIAFWQLGKTDMARAYIVPTLVAGLMLLTIGIGLFYTNVQRVKQFEIDYNQDATAFVQSEISRAEDTLKEYNTVVFTAIPLIIAACALLLLFFHSPLWKASLITTIAMLVVILLIDGTAQARIAAYHIQLLKVENHDKN